MTTASTSAGLCAILEALAPLRQGKAWTLSEVQYLLVRFADHGERDVRMAWWAWWASVMESLAALPVGAEAEREAVLDLVLEHWTTVFRSGDPQRLETLLPHLGHLGTTEVGQQERVREPLLSILVQTLGHENAILVSSAFQQLRHIHGEVPALSAYAPYLDVLARSSVPLLVTRPSIIRYLAILLGMPLRDFITRTLEWTLPALVREEATEGIAELAQLTGLDIPDLLIEHAGPILAHLFMGSKASLESCLFFFLNTASSNYGNLSILQVMKSCQLKLLTALVLELGREERERALDVLGLLQERLYPDFASLQLAPSFAGEPLLACFLVKDFLGIFSALNRMLHDPGTRPSRQVQVITCITTLVSVVGRPIESFLPQIMTLLQGALARPALREAALHGWRVMVEVLDCGALADSITIILLKDVATFPLGQQAQVQGILDLIVRPRLNATSTGMSTERVVMPELLPELPVLADLNRAIRQAQAELAPLEVLGHWIAHVPTGNPLVCQYYLEHIRRRIQQHQHSFWEVLARRSEASDADGTQHVHLTSLLRWLVGLMSPLQPRAIQLLAGDCIGLLGAPDPDVLDLDSPVHASYPVGTRGGGGGGTSASSRRQLLHDFVAGHRVGFVVKFVEDHLAVLYRSCQDSKRQSHLAYSIQELLKCIECRVDHPTWRQFQPLTQFTIQPLLSTKYSLHPGPSRASRSAPVYGTGSPYPSWVVEWTLGLMDRVRTPDAAAIFSACRNVLAEGEIALAKFLLPHAWLEVLAAAPMQGLAEGREYVIAEFLAILEDQTPSDRAPTPDRRQVVETIFSLLQHLKSWVMAHPTFSRDGQTAIQVLAVMEGALPLCVLARAASEIGDHARAFQAQEGYVRALARNAPAGAEKDAALAELAKIYASLGEPDGLEGLMSLGGHELLGLEQQVLLHESAGRWTAAQACYELALEAASASSQPVASATPASAPLNPGTAMCGLLHCFKELGHFEALLGMLRGISSTSATTDLSLGGQGEKITGVLPLINSYGVDAAWRLERWELLDAYLAQPHTGTGEASLGALMSALHHRDGVAFAREGERYKQLLLADCSVLHSFEASPGTGYRNLYGPLEDWAVLCDLESHAALSFVALGQASTHGPTSSPDQVHAQVSPLTLEALGALTRAWEARFALAGARLHGTREPLLSLQRVLLGDLRCTVQQSTVPEEQRLALQVRIDDELGKAWLHSAKLARKAGRLQLAHSALLHAERYGVLGVRLERAKWHYRQGSVHQAIAELQQYLEGGPGRALQQAQVALYAKHKLTLMRWMEESSYGNTSYIIGHFHDLITLMPEWEKSYFYLGRYYSRILDSPSMRAAEGVAAQTQVAQISSLLCRNYGRALTFGTRFIYQTLPRLLTVWLDFGESIGPLLEDPKVDQAKDERITCFRTVNKMVRKLCEKVPAYQFLTALPQLISRICHKNRNVYAVLELILVQVLVTYPQQTLWHLMAVAKAKTHPVRAARAGALLHKACTSQQASVLHGRGGNLEVVIRQAQELVSQLQNLCNHRVASNLTTISLNTEFRGLVRLAPLDIILPIQANMTVSLPAGASAVSHNPFPAFLPKIQGFKNQVQVMQSLQKPVKLTILGSDGMSYNFLCKPKDDLRKDARLMEFNDVVNKLFRRDPEARKRQLRIRTYAVVPLNEECGIIEWVENTLGFRHLVVARYKARKCYVSPQQVKKVMDRATPATCAEVFTREVLPKFPLVFHEWFLDRFPEPQDWMTARMAYGRSLATMSMVGFIVGLGDRHGENILLDGMSGEVVHVDLNCLFEKGQTFDVPERVPFRLTQNLVDALGLSGVSGVYTTACEVSMSVLRGNRESLVSVLETFVHDPLCEWARRGSSESSHAVALRIRETIDRKLQGYPNAQSALPLSIPGYVAELIAEATNPLLLASMYIGWAPFL